MKKITKKAINQALPTITCLRRWYRLVGTCGYLEDGQQTFSCAFADFDQEDGTVDITTYAYGEAKQRKHYYQEDGTVSISDIISDWIEGKADRHETVNAIYVAMMEEKED